jgi:glycosyltransferase involved in cell wall biosynthesis
LLKVLHIIDSGGLYGAEMVLLNLVAEQIKQGFEPVIASIGEKHIAEKPIEAEAAKRGFNVKKFRMLPGPNFIGMLAVLRYAQKEHFDLLHSHGYKGNVLLGLMPKYIRRIPLVATLHGYTSTNGFSKNKVYEWMDYHSHRFIDAVVLVHKGMLSNPKLGNRKNVTYHVINNGIPIDPPSHPPPFSLSVPSAPSSSPSQLLDKTITSFCQKGYTIGSIGRLSKEKGYNYLIEAVSLLIKQKLDIRLIIIGEGDQRGALESQVSELGLGDRVFLPGYREDARIYLACFNVFVLPSLTEGLPITLLEAMQARVPVVATEVGGIPEVLDNGRAGLLVQACEPHGLSEAIRVVYNDKKLLMELTNVAVERMATHYSSRAMANGYFSVYEKVVRYRNTVKVGVSPINNLPI